MTKISPEIQKITKIPQKQKKKWLKYPLKEKDQNAPQNLKNYQNNPEA